eukprot:4173796-Amphidinium_carterae.1
MSRPFRHSSQNLTPQLVHSHKALVKLEPGWKTSINTLRSRSTSTLLVRKLSVRPSFCSDACPRSWGPYSCYRTDSTPN